MNSSLTKTQFFHTKSFYCLFPLYQAWQTSSSNWSLTKTNSWLHLTTTPSCSTDPTLFPKTGRNWWPWWERTTNSCRKSYPSTDLARVTSNESIRCTTVKCQDNKLFFFLMYLKWYWGLFYSHSYFYTWISIRYTTRIEIVFQKLKNNRYFTF